MHSRDAPPSSTDFSKARAMQRDRLWTVAEVAEYLAVTERTVRAWQTEHRLPFLKIGGVIRFRPGQVMRWAGHSDEPAADRR